MFQKLLYYFDDLNSKTFPWIWRFLFCTLSFTIAINNAFAVTSQSFQLTIGGTEWNGSPIFFEPPIDCDTARPAAVIDTKTGHYFTAQYLPDIGRFAFIPDCELTALQTYEFQFTHAKNQGCY